MDPARADLTPCAHCAVTVSRRACAFSFDGEPLCGRCFAAQDLAATEVRAAEAEREQAEDLRNDVLGEVGAIVAAVVLSV